MYVTYTSSVLQVLFFDMNTVMLNMCSGNTQLPDSSKHHTLTPCYKVVKVSFKIVTQQDVYFVYYNY